MRSNKKDHYSHMMTARKARKALRDIHRNGKLTRAEALAQVARTTDCTALTELARHQSGHVKNAAFYKATAPIRFALPFLVEPATAATI